MRIRPTHFFLLVTILSSFFAAGVLDVAFSDVIPLRPYDLALRQVGSIVVQNMVQKTPVGSALGSILTVVFIILIVAGTAGAVANATTGITIAHAGFTANPNITRTVGLPTLTQMVPLVFVGIGIGFALDEMGGIL